MMHKGLESLETRHFIFSPSFDIIASSKSAIGLHNLQTHSRAWHLWKSTSCDMQSSMCLQRVWWGWLILTSWSQQAEISLSAWKMQKMTGWSVRVYQTEGAFNYGLRYWLSRPDMDFSWAGDLLIYSPTSNTHREEQRWGIVGWEVGASSRNMLLISCHLNSNLPLILWKKLYFLY